jgi:hypothetical protein
VCLEAQGLDRQGDCYLWININLTHPSLSFLLSSQVQFAKILNTTKRRLGNYQDKPVCTVQAENIALFFAKASVVAVGTFLPCLLFIGG